MRDLPALLLFCFLCAGFATCATQQLGNYGKATTSSVPKGMRAELQLRNDIVATAREYLGTKYKYACRDPKRGFDCSNFTSYVLEQHGISVSAGSGNQATQGQRISQEEATTGDLVVFRRQRGGKVFHVALVVENSQDELRVIHSTSSRGVVEDEILGNSWWAPKFREFRNVVSEL